MDYGRIIKRAWNVTWRNKALWLFGIAAALFGGGIHHGNPGSRGMQYSFGGEELGRWREFAPRMPMMPRGPFDPRRIPGLPYGEIQSALPMILGILGVLAVVGLLLFLVGLLVRYVSYGAMISMVNETEETDSTTFRSGLRVGWKRFLHLLATNIVLGLGMAGAAIVILVVLGIIGVLVLAPGILLVSSRGGAAAPGVLLLVGGGMVLFILFLLFGVAASALLTLLQAYAFRKSVLEEQGVLDAIGGAWTLLRARLRESLLMWLLLLAINLGLSLVAIPLGLMAAGAMVGPAMAVYAATKSVGGALLSAVPVLLVVIAISLLVKGIYTAFQSAVWTLAFRELKSTEALSE